MKAREKRKLEKYLKVLELHTSSERDGQILKIVLERFRKRAAAVRSRPQSEKKETVKPQSTQRSQG